MSGAGGLWRARRDGSTYRPGARDYRRVQLRDQSVRPGHSGETAARLVDQAVRLPHRARPRLHAVDADRRFTNIASTGPGVADVDPAQLHEGRPGGEVSRADAAAHRHRKVEG